MWQRVQLCIALKSSTTEMALMNHRIAMKPCQRVGGRGVAPLVAPKALRSVAGPQRCAHKLYVVLSVCALLKGDPIPEAHGWWCWCA